jgi:hypothetical protein
MKLLTPQPIWISMTFLYMQIWVLVGIGHLCILKHTMHICSCTHIGVNGKMRLSTKMSQLGHYETIRTSRNVHWERASQAKSRENQFIYNVENNLKIMKREKQIVLEMSGDSNMIHGHILLCKPPLRFNPNHG